MKTVAILTFTLAFSLGAQGGVIYDSFGPNDAFATSSEAGSSDVLGTGSYPLLAVPFAPLVPVTLDSVTVGMRHLSGNNLVRLTVRHDGAGIPKDVVLDTLDVANFLTDRAACAPLQACRVRPWMRVSLTGSSRN